MDIRRSGCRILFVGLGCPQTRTLDGGASRRLARDHAGVGAAFDFLSDRSPRRIRGCSALGLSGRSAGHGTQAALVPILLSEPAGSWRFIAWQLFRAAGSLRHNRRERVRRI